MSDQPSQPKHQHTQACYERKVVCGQREHAHENRCYEPGTVRLICDQTTHGHGAGCFLQSTTCGHN